MAQTEDTYTLPVALALYSKGQNATNYGLLLAGATVVVIPVLMVFLAFQRRVMRGHRHHRHQVARPAALHAHPTATGRRPATPTNGDRP